MAEPTLMKDGSIETWEDPNRLKISKPSFQNVKNNLKWIGDQAAITLNKVRNIVPKPPEQLVKGVNWAYQNSPYGIADQGAQLLGDDVSRYLINKGAPEGVGTAAALAIGLATPGFGPAKGVKGLDKARKIAIKANRANKGINFFPPNQTLQPAYATAGGSPNLKISSNKVNNPLMIKGGNVSQDVAQTALRKQPKVNAVKRYKQFSKDGYKVEHLTSSAKKLEKGDLSEKLEGLTQWTDEAAYRKAVQKNIDAGMPTADIRQTVGVYVNPKTGEVRQMMSRGGLQLRNPWDEGANTTLNRRLSLVQQQSKGTKAYNSTENVSTLMKQKNFKGTAEEFTAKYAIHHKRSIVAYEPFFYNLKAKEAAELRGLIEDGGIKLGDNIENLVAIPKRMHTLDKNSIHTWMRKNGIEGISKDWEGIVGSFDAQASLRKKFAKASVEERYEAFKLYLEYVQEPTDAALKKILDAVD